MKKTQFFAPFRLRFFFVFITINLAVNAQKFSSGFPELERPMKVYLKSWDIGDYPMYLKTPENDGGNKVIRIVATNGSVGYVPFWVSRGGLSGVSNKWASEGGLTDAVVKVMETTDLLDHELLYDRMVNAGIPAYARVAADIVCWDLHARMLNKPLHALLGTKRKEIVRYGDVRGNQPDFSPEEYAKKVTAYLKENNLKATKLHFPGAMGTDESIPFLDVLKTLRLVREAVGKDAILAYDPYPRTAESATASLTEAKELLKVLYELNYTWVEGPLVPIPEETQIGKYAELLKDAKIRIQPEGQGPIGDISSFETIVKWANAGAANQFSTDAYYCDGITPIIRLIKWAENRKQKDIVLNLHWAWVPHLQIAFGCNDDIFPYIEFPMSDEVPDAYFSQMDHVKLPDWPGVYLMLDSTNQELQNDK